MGDFNEVAARPLLPTDRGTVLLFSHYAIYEAMYESPFFWMWDDKPYRPIAAKHRGAFTEQFAARRLTGVFGREHVHTNVNLHRGKNIVGEADVLVIYGDRLIIVQAKAKKLTIAARKGNDSQLKADFAAAIQDSYDQGWQCANEMLAGGGGWLMTKGKTSSFLGYQGGLPVQPRVGALSGACLSGKPVAEVPDYRCHPPAVCDGRVPSRHID